MDINELIINLRSNGFRKLTGPPEHWLTTFNTGFWGLERKHEAIWKGLNPADLCVFHSTKSNYLQAGDKLNTGIIGVGVVEKTDKKSSLEWVGEINSNKNQWPFLIHFSQVWWFGEANNIVNQTIREKLQEGDLRIFRDIQKLTHKAISFKEMKRKDCCIAAQGSIGWVYRDDPNKIDSLVELLSTRLHTKSPLLIRSDPQITEQLARPDQYPEGATETTINEKAIACWWVNQNQTASHEISGGYMWSPKRNTNDGYNQFYENMRLVDNGDIVFSYYDQHIQHLGIVQRPGVSGNKPSEFGQAGDNWSNEGWFVPVEWHRLPSRLSPKSFFDKLKSTLPEKYSPLNRDTGDGLQNYLSAVPEPMAKVILSQLGDLEIAVIQQAQISGDSEDAVKLLDDTVEKEIVNNTAIDETERKAIVSSRRGQGRFRQNLASIEKSCRVTGVTDPRLLRASHIKPWRSCTDNHERLDGYNGLLLAPHIDLLFDRGYISFSDEGDLLISPRIDPEQLSLLSISSTPTLNVGSFTDKQKHYLKFHRSEVFLVNC